MDKKIYVEELFETIRKEGRTLSDVIKLFNKKFNSRHSEDIAEEKEIKDLCDKFEINIPFSFGLQEKAIRSLIEAFPQNNDEEKILSKVILINQLYSTALNTSVSTDVISVSDMAMHIAKIAKEQELDKKIREGKLEAVELIGNLDEYNNAYSFASKYCSWHNIVVYHCDEYPIMDSYTKGFMYYWCKMNNFQPKYTQADFLDYTTYYNAVVDFRKKECDGLSLKEIDSFLWIYSKAKRLAI